MINAYEVRGDHVAIFIDNPDGTSIETLIDLDDLEKVSSYVTRWSARRINLTYPYYVYGSRKTINARGKSEWKPCALHRLIMGFPDGLHVDHIDENTLDNRKKNLQSVTNSENVSKQMWRQKPRRVKDTLHLRHFRSQCRQTDFDLIKEEARKFGMSMEYWIAMVVAEKLGVKPWFQEYQDHKNQAVGDA